MDAEKKAMIQASMPRLAEHARETYGIPFNPGAMEQDTRPALIVEQYAKTLGKGREFHKAVETAYWQAAEDIQDHAVLARLAQAVGLPADALTEAFTNEDYENAVNADIMTAYRYGLNGVPALIFANKYLVSGAQPYPVLKQLMDKILAENG